MRACLTPPAGRARCETAGTQPKQCAPTGRWARAVPQKDFILPPKCVEFVLKPWVVKLYTGVCPLKLVQTSV